MGEWKFKKWWCVGLGNEDGSEDRKSNWRILEINFLQMIHAKINLGVIKEGFHVTNE